MRGTNGKDLNWLVTFLNLDFGTATGTIITGVQPTSPAGQRFLKRHGLQPAIDLPRIQQSLRERLSDLVAPESGLILWDAKPAVKKDIRQSFINRYYGDPTPWLQELLKDLNSVAGRVLWKATLAQRGRGNLHLNEREWEVTRLQERETLKARVYAILGSLIEHDRIRFLNRCPVCLKFFIRGRPWQAYCVPNGKCKKRADNHASAERKARARKAERSNRAALQEEKAKHRLTRILSDPAFSKYLPGGPTERHHTLQQLVRSIQRNPVKKFMDQCSTKIKHVLKEKYEWE
ncbi:MAG: hypothetical protein O7B35_01200 [Deltaproteobacteria bacterium]|nr:hypothetical protein [Deltaproteobacteria bacterium]